MNSTNYTSDGLLSDDKMNVIATINVITSSLSALGAGSIILCSVFHRKICFSEVYPIFQLSIADLLASLFFLSSTIMFLNNVQNYPGGCGPCDYITAVMTSFYISTLFLTLSYALEAFLRVRKRLHNGFISSSREQQRTVVSYSFMHLIYAVAWLVPLAGGIVLLTPTTSSGNTQPKDAECSTCLPVFHYTQDNPCWSHVVNGTSWHLAYKLVFLIPLIAVFFSNIFLYLCIARAFKQVSMRRGLYTFHQRQEESTVRRKAVLYQSAFLCCWLPTLILGIISFQSDFAMRRYFWLYVLQALLGPLQGFLNCIIYGWKREQFRRALSENSSLTSTNMPSYLSLTL
ncbi:transmembrane protein 116-like [Haliotis rufescens]|uniref:transmembrane protein 116-like n=1 Tax=Haliotis rufescens TaxID=6454 RepID=UPI00201F8B75|nr:transmembrane protein 116-like [Haliotis rufescens]XP_048239062.1 transmembrane protein 116-like [Haliotis rufescens]